MVNGWNVTGDVFARDAEGYYRYVARSDDMIVSSGYNISGPEIEAVLMEHPHVHECAVLGMPDAERGQIVRAVIVPAPGVAGDDVLAEALKAHVKARLSPYKYPRRVDFRDFLAAHRQRQAATPSAGRACTAWLTSRASSGSAAERAVAEVQDGMMVGLGTGRTASFAVEALAECVRGGLRVTATATSHATETLAARLGITLVPFAKLSRLDLTIDGADEIDPEFPGYQRRGRRAAAREGHRGRERPDDRYRRFEQTRGCAGPGETARRSAAVCRRIRKRPVCRRWARR